MARGFSQRSRSAERAEQIVAARLRRYGFDVYDTGIEHWDADMRERLYAVLHSPEIQEQGTFADWMLRQRLEFLAHTADLLAYHPTPRVVLWEVKSRDKPSPRGVFFMDEAVPRSYRVREWLDKLPPELRLPSWMRRPHVVAFVDLSAEPPTIQCCWDYQLPHFEQVYVPKEGDSPEQQSQLMADWPFTPKQSVPWRGSREPCVEVPDDADYLVPFDQFVEQGLLDLPADWRDFESA
jgi:hypothetical protein